MYPGEHTTITFWNKQYSEFTCDFKLELYPFDTQICTMGYGMDLQTSDQVMLVPHEEFEHIAYLGTNLLNINKMISIYKNYLRRKAEQ